jgi:hypothetical protein
VYTPAAAVEDIWAAADTPGAGPAAAAGEILTAAEVSFAAGKIAGAEKETAGRGSRSILTA